MLNNQRVFFLDGQSMENEQVSPATLKIIVGRKNISFAPLGASR